MEVFYFFMSGLVAVMAIAAVFIAKKAMNRGLTYSATHATLWALAFIAVSRVWHTLREYLNLESSGGIWPEIAEYVLLIIAFSVFIILIKRTNNTKKD